jgi:hypothetical protein
MLIDPHLNPHDLTPAELIDQLIEASVDGVVITCTHSTTQAVPYLKALIEEDFVCFVGVELKTPHGDLVLIPEVADESFFQRVWSPSSEESISVNGEECWPLDTLEKIISEHAGVVMITHPYSRLCDRSWGDRAFTLDWIDAAETRVGRGLPHRDFLSDKIAELKDWSRVGSSSGDSQYLGSALTVFSEDIESQEAICEALREGICWPIEFEDPMYPRARYQGVIVDEGPRRRTLEERERKDALDRVARQRGFHVEEEVTTHTSGGSWRAMGNRSRRGGQSSDHRGQRDDHRNRRSNSQGQDRSGRQNNQRSSGRHRSN